jgi:hypothetical protein
MIRAVVFNSGQNFFNIYATKTNFNNIFVLYFSDFL